MERKNKKKTDKVLIIAICLCVAISLATVGIIVLPEPIIAAIELDRSTDFVENSADIKIVLNSPTESGGILADAEAVLEKERAEAFSERLINILKNVKYSKTDKINTGVWKTKIVIYNTTDEQRLYIDSKGVYIENGQRLIGYKIPEKLRPEFDSLYSEIEASLKQ